MFPNLLTRERVQYSWRTREETKRLKYMKLSALLALRKCDPKNHRVFVRINGEFLLWIDVWCLYPILAVSILQVVDAGTEMLDIEIEKNAKYRWRGDLVLLGCGRCFIYSAFAWPLPFDHMMCDARYLVMSVTWGRKWNALQSTPCVSKLMPAILYHTVCSHICKLFIYLKNYKLI
jgi:hypothetical protein